MLRAKPKGPTQFQMEEKQSLGDEHGLIEYVGASPSPFHACQLIRERLVSGGYRELDERDVWSVEAGGRYVVQRGQKLIAALNLGTHDLAATGARIVASHIDSPCLRLKRNAVGSSETNSVLNVSIYGSPILHTWQDRDLVVAGSAYIAGERGSGIRRRLVRSDFPICRVASIAPHLRDPAKEPNATPVEALSLKPILGSAKITAEAANDLIRHACGIGAETLIGWDLMLADAQPPAFVGLNEEYISSARLDNLFSSYCLLSAIMHSGGKAAALPYTQIAVWFDSEEIGSQTFTGARSDFVGTLMARLCELTAGPGAEANAIARARSLMVSIDMGHADNPGYPGRIDAHHLPKINEGVAIKHPAQGNYAEASDLAAWYEHACRERSVPIQHFMYKTGHRGGASLGPIATTQAGIRGFDIGAALLGMHSIREMGGRDDVGHTINALATFLESDHPPMLV